MEGLVKLTGLWLSKEGKSLSGSCGQARFLVLKNTFKTEGSKEPDYELFVGQNEKKEAPAAPEQPDSLAF